MQAKNEESLDVLLDVKSAVTFEKCLLVEERKLNIWKSNVFSLFQFHLHHKRVFLNYDSMFFIHGEIFKKATCRFLKDGLLTNFSSKTSRKSSFLVHT